MKFMYDNSSQHRIPKHVAIIMDGNGRWAKKHGKLRIKGHLAGTEAVQKAVQFAIKNEIQSLTLYAFSSENWSRTDNEVSNLMEIFALFLNDEVENLNIHNVKLNIIGDISRFKPKLQNRIKHAINLTIHNTGLQLNIAANYGGRWDITNAIQLIAEKIKSGLLLPEHINEDSVNEFISLHDQPTVDLVIRTGKEYRISNFLLWQIAYSEFYFTDVLWPDFDEAVFKSAILSFNQRDRRFGNTIPDDIHE
ncbi:Ditrans,polycis-undecaprenyl-diphosphate synthase ((2E,6E)-farnesyl-diphosphate specific) [Candidatus Arsenophonus lipoptenae]|uniref:Ditrans,polycis-undecaprenyl-diphosphate synthase ((2E,6E)-farnesyl-diphosphate specific) n=1 Tax=Candidatus Arsenophonus lipoptenae TaxID=634113 RepID=A0A120HPS3_9GAMM|nr:polyprenyl diphosphate synthase [Candidatus Arsenophonus lipoptenae]AMA64618.1 Ditrans,polycis-undecaprenyl-diphosphate synthase ((2E,6E)-farnesyl-diphosphate specific) [Candidatus Arsenophonus lipoptenae]